MSTNVDAGHRRDVARIDTISELPMTAAPFGAAWLADPGVGVDLSAFGYVEEELWLTGVAGEWGYDDDFTPVVLQPVRYATRALVRRPLDSARFSGTVQLEPLHPDLDRAPTWQVANAWIMARGHAWVGVTQSATVADDLAARWPSRYGGLHISRPGLGYDILGAVAVALKGGRLPIQDVRSVTMSGWSITGSLCRVFVQEGFVTRHLDGGGISAVDAVLIGKSSGGLVGAGYPPLSRDATALPPDHPRRVVTGTVPTFEVLTESEAETHGPVLREDADRPDDRYRLVQIAATTHRELRPAEVSPHEIQYAASGGQLSDTRINEVASDARFGLFAGALLEHLDRWARSGAVPPRAPRFEYTPDSRLRRDPTGTVIGGIRPPWLAVPTSHYRPTSTPAPGACLPLARFPGAGTPAHAASLIGHRVPFTADELATRYRNAAQYRALSAAHCDELVDQGWLLRADAESYLESLQYPGDGE